MNLRIPGGTNRIIVVMAAMTLVWGISGLMLKRSAGTGGYDTGLGGFVSRVEEFGAAELAGLAVRDRILSVQGVPLKHAWSNPSLDQVGIGAVQSLTVERAGETREFDLIWQSPSYVQWRSLLIDFTVACAFLGFGLWAFLATNTAAGFVLALLGLCYCVANLDGPTIAGVDSLIRFIQLNLGFIVTVLLLHFLLVFPRRKTAFGKRVPMWLVYLPFLGFFVFGLAEWELFPDLISEYRMVIASVDLLYMGLAVVALIHSWVTLGREVRHSTRFNVILWGLAIAIGPFVILGLLGLALPDFVMPGVAYLALLGAAIPGSMALAVVSGASAEPGG